MAAASQIGRPPSITSVGTTPAGFSFRYVGRLLFALFEVERVEPVRQLQLDRQPVHDHRRGRR